MDETEAATAAYTLWPLSDVQQFGSLMAVSESTLDDKKNRLSLAEWRDAVRKVPGAILKLHGVQTLPDELMGFTRMPRQDKLVPLLRRLYSMAESAESFYSSQGGTATSSGGGAATTKAAPSEEKSASKQKAAVSESDAVEEAEVTAEAVAVPDGE